MEKHVNQEIEYIDSALQGAQVREENTTANYLENTGEYDAWFSNDQENVSERLGDDNILGEMGNEGTTEVITTDGSPHQSKLPIFAGVFVIVCLVVGAIIAIFHKRKRGYLS